MKDKVNKKLINYILILLLILLLIVFLQYTNLLTKVVDLFFALIPFYIGFFLSWLLTPVSDFLHVKFKISKKYSNALSLVFSIFIVLFFFLIIIPLGLIQARGLLDTFPEIWNSFLEKLPKNLNILNIDFFNIMDHFNLTASDLISYAKDYFMVITNGVTVVVAQLYKAVIFIFQIIFGYIIAFYFMGNISGFVKGIINLLQFEDKDEKRALLLEMSKVLFSYIRGVFVVSIMVGTLVSIGAAVIGIEGSLVFGFISGITNVIPYLGPVLGGIPLFIVALSMGYKQAILSILLISIVQFVESNFFQPKIMSHATDLHPVTIIVGLLVFGNLFGIIGFVISTPILSMFNVWLKQSKYKDKIRI